MNNSSRCGFTSSFVNVNVTLHCTGLFVLSMPACDELTGDREDPVQNLLRFLKRV